MCWNNVSGERKQNKILMYCWYFEFLFVPQVQLPPNKRWQWTHLLHSSCEPLHLRDEKSNKLIFIKSFYQYSSNLTATKNCGVVGSQQSKWPHKNDALKVVKYQDRMQMNTVLKPCIDQDKYFHILCRSSTYNFFIPFMTDKTASGGLFFLSLYRII